MCERIKIFFVEEEVALLLLTGRARITNLPDRSVFRRALYDFARGGFSIVVEHRTFDAVEAGREPPVHLVQLEMIDS